jgi:hypothetical protein
MRPSSPPALASIVGAGPRLALFAVTALVAGSCGKQPLDLDPGGDAGAPAVSARWIYVATSHGLERVGPAGGPLQPFGSSERDTVGVFPSPNRSLVAQVFASRYVSVVDADGSSRGAIDANAQVLGWSDDQTLIAYWETGGMLVQFDLLGQSHTLDLPQEYAFFTSVSASPRGHWLAALALPAAPMAGQALALLSPRDGSLVADLGATSASNLVWTGDELLAFPGDDGGLEVVTAGTRGRRALALTGASPDCGLATWYGPGRVLGGSDSVRAPCGPVLIDVDDGTASPPSAQLPRGLASPPFSLSSDGRDVAFAIGDELFVGAADGSAFRSLGHARAAIVGVGW